MNELYIIPGSCSTGIHILMNQLGENATITPRDELENYHTLVPSNQVPALNVEGKILSEGANIALYLLNKHGHSILNNPEFNQWLMFNYATLHPAYSKLFSVNGAMEESSQKYELMQKLGDRVASLWAIVDDHLKGKSYMVGNEPSIVDYLLPVYLRWGNSFPDVKIPVGRNVIQLVEKVLELPQVSETFKKESIEFQIPKNTLMS